MCKKNKRINTSYSWKLSLKTILWRLSVILCKTFWTTQQTLKWYYVNIQDNILYNCHKSCQSIIFPANVKHNCLYSSTALCRAAYWYWSKCWVGRDVSAIYLFILKINCHPMMHRETLSLHLQLNKYLDKK